MFDRGFVERWGLSCRRDLFVCLGVCYVCRPSLSLRACLGLSLPPVALAPLPGGLRCYVLRLFLEVVGVAGVGRPTKEASERKRRELNARQRAYVVWCATPPALREIQTQEELCEVLGVSRQRLWQWSKDPRIVEAIRFVTLQNAGSPEKVQAILDMVFERAMERKDVRYAEVWLKASGVMTQFGRSGDLLETVDELEQDSIADMSLEELQRVRDLALADRAEAAAIEIAKRAEVAGGC